MPGTWTLYVIPRGQSEKPNGISDVEDDNITSVPNGYVHIHGDEKEHEIDKILKKIDDGIKHTLSRGIKPDKDSRDYDERDLYYTINGAQELRAIREKETKKINDAIVPLLDKIGLGFPLYDVNLSKMIADYAKSDLVCFVSLSLY